MVVLNLNACHFNLLNQFLLVGINRVQLVEHMVLFHMGRRITQCTHGVKRGDGFFTLIGGVNALRFIDNHNRVGLLDKFNRLGTGHAVVCAVNDVGFVLLLRVGKAFPECIDIDHHNLYIRAGRKVTHIRQLTGIVSEIVKGNVFVQLFKMSRRNFQ